MFLGLSDLKMFQAHNFIFSKEDLHILLSGIQVGKISTYKKHFCSKRVEPGQKQNMVSHRDRQYYCTFTQCSHLFFCTLPYVVCVKAKQAMLLNRQSSRCKLLLTLALQINPVSDPFLHSACPDFPQVAFLKGFQSLVENQTLSCSLIKTKLCNKCKHYKRFRRQDSQKILANFKSCMQRKFLNVGIINALIV